MSIAPTNTAQETPGNDGFSMSFCAADGDYANTAWQSVIHHEYGHHAIECGGSGQGQYGEGMSDCFSLLNADDPTLGAGYDGDCNVGLRSADNDDQYPCTGEDHDCAQLLSGCIWDTRNELIVTEPTDYLQILSCLTVNSILLHTGELITPQIAIDFLTLDDDNGDTLSMTARPTSPRSSPASAPTTCGRARPPENDSCEQASPASPGRYGGATTDMTNDGSADCGSSNSTADVWYRYTPARSGNPRHQPLLLLLRYRALRTYRLPRNQRQPDRLQ